MTNTLEKLRSILVRDYRLPEDAMTRDALLDGLGIDSLGVAELLFNIEDEFKVILPPDPVNLPMLGDVVDFIDGLIAAQHLPDTEVDQSQIGTVNGSLTASP